MNIVLVTYEFPPLTATGGIGSYMYHLAILLTGKGHSVTVFSANPDGVVVTVAELAYCTNYQVPAKNNNSFRKAVSVAFETFFKSNEVDVIESPEVGACALYIKKKFPQIPLVVKMHTPGVLITKVSNTYMPLGNKLRFIAGSIRRGKLDLGYWANHDKNKATNPEYAICMTADILLSPSLALKKWAVNFWNINPGKIQIQPNPFSVKEELFSLPLSNRPQIISFVGKLSVLKGMKALTKAIPAILEKNKDCKIFFVGRDEIENGESMQQYMQKELAQFKSNLVFTGALNKKALQQVYAQSKVCVFPSLWENYPTVILEAMAAGAAIAASAVGGIPELVCNNKTGVLFNPYKPTQIAKAVNNLLRNEQERLLMVGKARIELQERMNDSAFENDQLKVYTQFEKQLSKI